MAVEMRKQRHGKTSVSECSDGGGIEFNVRSVPAIVNFILKQHLNISNFHLVNNQLSWRNDCKHLKK